VNSWEFPSREDSTPVHPPASPQWRKKKKRPRKNLIVSATLLSPTETATHGTLLPNQAVPLSTDCQAKDFGWATVGAGI
jgi:hypothetical protein